MSDNLEIPKTVNEGERLIINGDRQFTVVRESTYSYSSNRSIKLNEDGVSAPFFKSDTTHVLKIPVENPRHGESKHDGPTLLTHKMDYSGMRRSVWEDPVRVESIEFPTREATAEFHEAEEGDEILWNDRKRPLQVTNVAHKNTGKTVVKAEGDWDGAAQYRLVLRKGEAIGRVERLQMNHSTGYRKFYKDADLEGVSLNP